MRHILAANTANTDAIGNPLNDGTWRYTWQNGRQLSQLARTGDTVTFAYNAAGLRVRKTSTTRGTTEYTLSGKRIVHQKRGATEMHFWYTGQGSPAMASYNGKYYYYVVNAQGDVLALLDKANNNAEVVSYAYDAWGKQVGCTGPMAGTLGVENPFRYRGYVFDEETGLYYLRSRYYNPGWGRFVNADGITGHSGLLLSANLFCYCKNEPISYFDPNGKARRSINLGKGWRADIDSPVSSTMTKKHVHIVKGKKHWAQHDDGSPHDKGNNSPGSPPKEVLNRLLEEEGWDWEQKAEDWKKEISISQDEAGKVHIKYPDGKRVIVKMPDGQGLYFGTMDDMLEDYYGMEGDVVNVQAPGVGTIIFIPAPILPSSFPLIVGVPAAVPAF